MNSTPVIEIEGDLGEGGGQIVRSSLALALVTGRPVALSRIRAGRSKPGLLRQHLTAVQAAIQVGMAQAEGAEMGSRNLVFCPGGLQAGRFHFDIGSAGSTTLVLQTILPALLMADGESQVILEGGTHNPLAPTFEFLNRAFLPLLNRLGPKVTAHLVRHGFYPAGGGRIEMEVCPSPLRGFDLLDRGELKARLGRAVVSQIPQHVAEREADVLRRRLSLQPHEVTADVVTSPGPGNVVSVEYEYANVTEVVTEFGRIGVSAERVAANAVRSMRTYLRGSWALGEYLADQWMLPLALAVARGNQAWSFSTGPLSSHGTTHFEIIKRFLPVNTEVVSGPENTCQVTISPG